MWQSLYTSGESVFRKRTVCVIFVAAYSLLVFISAAAVCRAIFVFPLPPVLTVIATVEQVRNVLILEFITIYLYCDYCYVQLRLSMKSYSFVRENAYKVLYPWNKDDDSGPAVWYEGQMSPKVASFSQYFYFIFAPTMLYRDHYPRYVKISM